MTSVPASAAVTFWAMVGRSVRRRCPRCGEGRLFSGYLKQVDACSECKEPFGHIRADDGPAWFTILIVGHILAPLFMLVPKMTMPVWGIISALCLFSVLLIAVVLPCVKGVFIALIWRAGCAGAEKQP